MEGGGHTTPRARSNTGGAPKQEVPAAQKKEFLYKILVVGNMGTGKTSIIKRYCDNEFSDNYKSTIGVDFALKSIEWGHNSMVHLQLWDIAGQERYGNLTRVYYRDAVGGFVVLDLGRPLQESLDIVKKWKGDIDSKIRLWNGDALPVVLLANKVDLLGDKKADERTLEEFAKENGFIGWFATSAKENLHVEKAMTFLINHIIHNYQNGPQPENTDAMHLTLDEQEIRKYEDEGGGCSC